MERKRKLDARRSVLIREKGLDSLEYIQQLVNDIKEVTRLQKKTIDEVTSQVSMLVDVLKSSQDAYIEEMKSNVSAKSIQKVLGLFICHPFRSKIQKTQAEAQEIVADILEKAVLRITKDDTAGLIEQPV